MISVAPLQQIMVCLLFVCFPPDQSPTVINNYAQECGIIRPSRKDTDETLRQIAAANAKCRAAKGQKNEQSR